MSDTEPIAPPAAPPPNVTPEEAAAYIKRLAEDFVFFIQELWKQNGSDKIAPHGEVELDICRFVANSRSNRRGVLAWRFSGKTFLISAGYSCWRLYRDPNIKILIVSKSKLPSARDIVRLIRGWIETVWFLQHLNPKGHTEEFATDQTFQFDVAGSLHSKVPSVQAQGIEGMITGLHTHIVIADDVETPENSKTVASRLELEGKVKEFSAIATMGDREIIYVGTYHHEDSLYLKLAKRGYAFQTWPVLYPTTGEEFLNLAPMYSQNILNGTKKPGDIASPLRVTDQFVEEQKSEGKTYWLMQYMLVCNLANSNRYPLRLADLIVFPVQRDKAPLSIAWGQFNDRSGSTMVDIPIVGWESDRLYGPIMFDGMWAPYTGIKAAIDPAGRGTDLTGLSIVGHLGGMLWCKYCNGLTGGMSEENLNAIAELLRHHGARECYVETNIDTFDAFFPALETVVRRHHLEPGEDAAYPEGWKCQLEKRHSTGQKETRIISALEGTISTHRLVIHPDCLRPSSERPREHELQWQIAAITKDRKCLKEDGAIDSLSLCVKEWLTILRLDPKQAALTAKTRFLENELKRHYQLTGRRRGPEPCWIDRR